MKNRHVAIFTPPGLGHVYPALAIGSELVRRGYRTTHATTAAYASVIGRAGVEPITFDWKFKTEYKTEDEDDWSNVWGIPPQDPRWWKVLASSYYPSLIDLAAVTLSKIEDFYKRNVPDLILYDPTALAGRILATRLKSPAVQVSPTFAPYKKYVCRVNGVCVTPEPVLRFARILDGFLFAHGIKGTDNLWHTEKFNIHLLPKAFQYHAEFFDERFCFVGACLNRPFEMAWQNRSAEKPIILVSDFSGGDDTNYFRSIIDALCDLEYHIVLSIGPRMDKISLGPLPENVEINQHASHLEILPHACLSICAAGMGSTLEAVYHGVPIVALPATPFLEEIAYRVTELGLGIRLPRDSTSTVIRRNVQAALEDSALQHRVKEMQQVFNSCGGTVLAVDEIERFLRCRF